MREIRCQQRAPRRLILLDLENLAGSARVAPEQATHVFSEVSRALQLVQHDLTYVGGHPGNGLQCMRVAQWCHGSVCLLKGKDGADRALAGRAADLPESAIRSDISPVVECVIGSGDRYFTETAHQMKSRGLFITVLARPMSVSHQLYSAADRLLLISPNSGIPTAQVA